MIRVDKPIAPPAVLIARGVNVTQAHCNDYTASADDYRSGAKIFDFDKSIYAAPEVKDTLLAAQRKKCAFCESLVRHISYGAVEHFRPKGGYKQRTSDTLKRPGYYWLAYNWDNLFFCCQLCNEQFKRNLFPLRDGRSRARSHTHPISAETPLLIHPAGADSTIHIGFKKERAVAINGGAMGKTAIRILGLNRPELREARGRRLESLRNLLRVRDRLHERIAVASKPSLVSELRNVQAVLDAARDEGSEYAAMARALLGP